MHHFKERRDMDNIMYMTVVECPPKDMKHNYIDGDQTITHGVVVVNRR